jgi:hypothetical protein
MFPILSDDIAMGSMTVIACFLLVLNYVLLRREIRYRRTISELQSQCDCDSAEKARANNATSPTTTSKHSGTENAGGDATIAGKM